MESQIMERNQILAKLSALMTNRAEARLADGAAVPEPEYLMSLKNEVTILATQAGVSSLALELLLNPNELIRMGTTNLTSGEEAFKQQNIELIKELHEAGLL